MLEHHGHPGAGLAQDALRRHVQPVVLLLTEGLAAKPDLAACGVFEKIDAAEQGGLARAAGTDEEGDFPLLHVQVDSAQHVQRAEPLVQRAYGEEGCLGIGRVAHSGSAAAPIAGCCER